VIGAVAPILPAQRPARLCAAILDRRDTVPAPPFSTAVNIPLECPNCGSDIRLIAFITEPSPIRKILTHLGEPLEPPPVSPARGPPTDWGELIQAHDDREAVQISPDELQVIDIHSL